MEIVTAVGLDIGVILIIAFCIYGAAKKGFLRTVIQMAAYIGILVLALTISRVAAPIIYTRMVEPALFEQYLGESAGSRADENENEKDNAVLVLAHAQSADGDDTSGVQEIIDEVLRQLEESGMELSQSLRDQLAALKLDELDLSGLGQSDSLLGLEELISPEIRGEIIRDIADQTVRPVVTGAIRVVCFAVVFAVLSLVANLILAALGVVRYLPVIGSINSFLGGIVGLLQGLLLVWVAALLLYGILQLCGGEWWIFSNEVVESSMLFQYFIFPGIIGE